MSKPPSIPLPVLLRAVAALAAAKEVAAMPGREHVQVIRSHSELEYYVGVIAGYTNVETTA